jgi:hypothetical protein
LVIIVPTPFLALSFAPPEHTHLLQAPLPVPHALLDIHVPLSHLRLLLALQTTTAIVLRQHVPLVVRATIAEICRALALLAPLAMHVLGKGSRL